MVFRHINPCVVFRFVDSVFFTNIKDFSIFVLQICKCFKLPCFPAEQFLGLRIVHHDLIQVLFGQDEEVSKTTRYDISRTSVPSSHGKQASYGNKVKTSADSANPFNGALKNPHDLSPDLPEHRSCFQGHKHSLPIRTTDDLHFTGFNDVHLTAHFIL